MSTKAPTETASASAGTHAEAPKTPSTGFDANATARTFLGPKWSEKKVRALAELFCKAGISGYDQGYKQGRADQKSADEFEASRLIEEQEEAEDTEPTPPPPTPAPTKKIGVWLDLVITKEGTHTRLHFADMPGVHFLTEHPAASEIGHWNKVKSLLELQGRAVHFIRV